MSRISAHAHRGALALSLVLAGLFYAPPAFAEEPVDMGGQRIADHSGVLGEKERKDAEAQASQAGLYAVFVDSFDGTDATRWCVEAAEKSHLDSRATLLVVATQDRNYDLCAGSDVDLDGAERRAVGDAAREALSDDDWAGAVENAAAQITSGGRSGDAGSADVEEDSLGGGLLGLLGVGALGVGAVATISAVKRARRGRAGGARGQSSTGGGSPDPRDASAVVVAADDAVRQAREDLDYASAQLGEADVSAFSAALREAEAHRDRALELLRSSRDAAGAEGARAAQQAIAEANEATRILQPHLEALNAARENQQRLTGDIDAAGRLLMDRRAGLEGARAELERLHHDFPNTTFSSIDDNVDQATRLLDSAEQALASAREDVDREERSRASQTLLLAQRALTQAGAQIDQIMGARSTLGDVNRALLREISALSSDIADAQSLNLADTSAAHLVAEANEAISMAESARAGSADPLAAMERMSEANAALDEVLDPLREAAASKQRAGQAVAQRVDLVARQVAETEAYISSHRGAVGSTARERSRQAVGLVERARQNATSDPKAAERDLQTAEALSRQALSIAQNDVAAHQSNDDWGRGPGSGGIDMGSLILGGILGSSMSGGHRSSGVTWGGFGGGMSGGGGGFSGGFGGGGGFSGGFGGGKF